MQKIEIIALLEDSKNLIERMQRRGVVEIIDIDDEELVKLNTNLSVAQFERSINAAESALLYIEKYCEKKDSVFDLLNGRKAMSTNEFSKQQSGTEKTLNICYSVLECSRKIGEYENTILKNETRVDVLSPWKQLNIPQNFKGTKMTRCFIGTLPEQYDAETVSNEILAIEPEAYLEVEIVSSRKEQTCVAVFCHKDNELAVFSALRDIGFIQITDVNKRTFEEEIEDILKQNEELKNKISDCIKSIKSYGNTIEDIKFLIDYLVMRRDKYAAISKLGISKKTTIVRGYIPKKYVDGLVAEFEKKYTIAITVTDPDEDDDVPVLLKNGKFSEPVEGITEMYALPNKRDVDPSSVMAFFYYLFFGMMLSDAGYGLVMFIGTSIVLKKFNVEGTLKRSLKMFRYCSISTLIWGALFGSWFGDLPQIIASNFFGKTIETTAIWFEPIDDPVKLLLFSFALGIMHLFWGVAVNFGILWKEGKKLDAFCETVPIYLTVLGVAPIGASILIKVPPFLSDISKYIALAGVILIILTAGRVNKNIFLRFFGGFYGLYNVATGYLGDILSYSRLLALGLATGSIAGVINMMAVMPENKVFKAILLIVVGIVGHLANMGINLLGAYVHSDRLQFVELFSKFYEGGGRPFKPLKTNTKYIKFKKENIYE